MTRFLFDTAIFVYARGVEHPYREACRELVELSRRGVIAGEASVELVQEFAHVMRRRGIDGVAVREQSRAVAALCLLHDFAQHDLRLALNLVATSTGVGVRDAVHAATALRRGIPVVVSPERAFDQIAGLERVEPADALQRLTRRPPRLRRAD